MELSPISTPYENMVSCTGWPLRISCSYISDFVGRKPLYSSTNSTVLPSATLPTLKSAKFPLRTFKTTPSTWFLWLSVEGRLQSQLTWILIPEALISGVTVPLVTDCWLKSFHPFCPSPFQRPGITYIIPRNHLLPKSCQGRNGASHMEMALMLLVSSTRYPP